MFKKVCPLCNRESYSSVENGRWNCPYRDCGIDITNVPVQEAIDGESEDEEE